MFVYGLLMPGHSLHHVVAPFVVRLAPATASGKLYDAGWSEATPTEGVPAARFDEVGEIEGFVLWLDEARLDEALALLDDIEDEGEMYSRITVDVVSGGGIVPAQAYHYLLSLGGKPKVGERWRKD
jgi:gamma-glutamylcyclotransferase (GGCT)/AIG2-like uncharacterized protein YtfP